MSKELRTEASAEANSVIDNLLVAESQLPPLVQVKESEFIHTYLPIILAAHAGKKPSLAQWVERAGGVSHGMSIVDDAGKELYTTPGALVQVSLSVNAGLHNMVADVAHQESLGLPVDAVYAEYLNSDTAKLNINDPSTRLIEWYRIFARYGWKMDISESKEQVRVESKEKSNNTVDFEEDELM